MHLCLFKVITVIVVLETVVLSLVLVQGLCSAHSISNLGSELLLPNNGFTALGFSRFVSNLLKDKLLTLANGNV